MRKYIRLFIQVIIAYLLFSILSEYFNDFVLTIILIIIIIIFILFRNKGKVNHLHYLASSCDVNKYLDYVKTQFINKDQSRYLLYVSYGNIYNGDFENIENDISKIDISKLKSKEKFLYDEIILKSLYNNKDIEGYEKKLNKMNDVGYNKNHNNNLQILKAPLYILKEEYTELVDLMFELIPKQRQSYRVIELEYYLSVAYVALGKDEDAIAVLEFITKRDLKLTQVVKSQTLLDSIKSN